MVPVLPTLVRSIASPPVLGWLGCWGVLVVVVAGAAGLGVLVFGVPVVACDDVPSVVLVADTAGLDVRVFGVLVVACGGVPNAVVAAGVFSALVGVVPSTLVSHRDVGISSAGWSWHALQMLCLSTAHDSSRHVARSVCFVGSAAHRMQRCQLWSSTQALLSWPSSVSSILLSAVILGSRCRGGCW